MASKKKESEGIALLSMYDDDEEEEEDVEMEDIPENNHNNQEEEEKQELQDSIIPETTPSVPPQSQNPIPGEEVEDLEDRVSTPFYSPSPSQLPPPPPPPQPTFEPQLPRKRSLAIVDYAHDETAMSPEPEEGEIMGSGEDPQSTDDKSPPVHTFTPNVRGTPQPSEQPEHLLSDNNTIATCVGMETEIVVVEETVTMSVEVQRAVDPLDNFLPPPPETMCPKELQDKINKFLQYKKAGKSFNSEVRNRKDYRNPDFLLHAVRYQDIDQIGSCFNKDVFDPHGYEKSDFYDELEADMKREMERKEQERKKSQRLDFVSGGTQAVGVPAVQKNTIQNPVSAVPTAASTGFHSHPVPTDSGARESRQNKKSKWDKVDGDRKNPLPITGQDALSTAAAHAALLSAAQVGAGYTLYAQQKRKEAEEKKSTEKRRSRS